MQPEAQKTAEEPSTHKNKNYIFNLIHQISGQDALQCKVVCNRRFTTE